LRDKDKEKDKLFKAELKALLDKHGHMRGVGEFRCLFYNGGITKFIVEEEHQ